LPTSWIERLFDRLSGFYGSKFGDLWRGCDIESVKRTWAEALAGYSPDEIKHGLNACLSRIFPPTLPEFLMLCRPPVDFESAFCEAVEQMRRRESGCDEWSSPAIYWAAVQIGSFDLRNATWPVIKPRWTAVLQAQLDKREWPEIPPRLAALPAPGQSTISREEAAKRVKSLGLQLNPRGDKDWALRIQERKEKGDAVHHLAGQYADEALAA
jgi:hypothetical protein